VLFGGAIITEAIFQYRGIGFLLADSIAKNNNPIIMAIVTFSVIAFVALSLVVDALYAWLDPRIRLT
jgi:ABC-type dipeptide/oligopeptide/nickel transport system permease component